MKGLIRKRRASPKGRALKPCMPMDWLPFQYDPTDLRRVLDDWARESLDRLSKAEFLRNSVNASGEE